VCAYTDLQVDAVDVLESAIAERQIVAGVAEAEREPKRRVARVGVREVRDGVLPDAVTDPVVRVARNSFDVDDAVRSLFLGPDQRPRLRYCAPAPARRKRCSRHYGRKKTFPQKQLECGPMPNLMVAMPNIGGALCSTPHSVADAHY